MRATIVFLKHLKAFPYYIYGIFVTIFNFIQPIETHVNENSSSDVNEFIKSFENKYGDIRPLFATCNYITCVNRAKSTLTYLLIYLHGDDHEDSDYFCRNTLCDPIFMKFVSDSGLLFWACNINSNEGFSVSRIIREHSYPFIGVVALSPNNRMYLVARSEGILSTEQLKKFISSAIVDNSVGVSVCRAEREERCNNRLLRQEQANEYLECLRIDQEKDRLEMEQMKGRLIRKQKLDKELEEQTQCLMLWKIRQNIITSILPSSPTEGDKSPHVNLKVKFPSGGVVQKSFYVTDSIKLLYYSIYCSEDCPRNFTVFSNFPKKQINCQPLQPEWDNGSILRYPREGFGDPCDFISAQLTVSTTLYVVDNDA